MLVTDFVEAEVYRYALHDILSIAPSMLSHMQKSLFGAQVQKDMFPDHSQASGLLEKMAEDVPKVATQERDVQGELGIREDMQSSRAATSVMPHAGVDDKEDAHEFTAMAAKDRLSRSLAIQRDVSVPIEIAFQMVSDVSAYPQWMPFCTSACAASKEEADGGPSTKRKYDVGFGLETFALGAVGDTVKYQVSLLPPTSDPAAISQVYQRRPGSVRKVARVVADTVDGFRYGKRLVYDRA